MWSGKSRNYVRGKRGKGRECHEKTSSAVARSKNVRRVVLFLHVAQRALIFRNMFTSHSAHSY